MQAAEGLGLTTAAEAGSNYSRVFLARSVEGNPTRTQALFVLEREGGAILCVPPGAFPEGVLA